MAATRKVGSGVPLFPSCSFLLSVSSLLLSCPFLSLFYFLLFRSSFSPLCLCFSLCFRPLFLNNHPPVSSLLGLPLFLPPLFPSLYIIPSVSNRSLNPLSKSFSPLRSLSLSSSKKNSSMSSQKLSCKSPPFFVLPTLVFIRGKGERATLPCPITPNG